MELGNVRNITHNCLESFPKCFMLSLNKQHYLSFQSSNQAWQELKGEFNPHYKKNPTRLPYIDQPPPSLAAPQPNALNFLLAPPCRFCPQEFLHLLFFGLLRNQTRAFGTCTVGVIFQSRTTAHAWKCMRSHEHFQKNLWCLLHAQLQGSCHQYITNQTFFCPLKPSP